MILGHAHPAVVGAVQEAAANGLSFGAPCPAEVEMARVLPVVGKLAKTIQAPISIDTYKSSVARSALDMGACIVNDISALRGDPNMASVVAEAGVPVVLMHMKGTPRDMQLDPRYNSLISEIISFLRTRIQAAVEAGISPNKIIIDPGIGFGKSVGDNLKIINELYKFKVFGLPIFLGLSRKSFIGKILNLDVDKRLVGTIAASVLSLKHGANILRVHDVRETKEAVKIASKILIN